MLAGGVVVGNRHPQKVYRGWIFGVNGSFDSPDPLRRRRVVCFELASENPMGGKLQDGKRSGFDLVTFLFHIGVASQRRYHCAHDACHYDRRQTGQHRKERARLGRERLQPQ
jgi:hypothetical protein